MTTSSGVLPLELDEEDTKLLCNVLGKGEDEVMVAGVAAVGAAEVQNSIHSVPDKAKRSADKGKANAEPMAVEVQSLLGCRTSISGAGATCGKEMEEEGATLAVVAGAIAAHSLLVDRTPDGTDLEPQLHHTSATSHLDHDGGAAEVKVPSGDACTGAYWDP